LETAASLRSSVFVILRLAGMMISPVSAVDDVERDLLAEQDVGQRLGQDSRSLSISVL
jgi:hypothetical protein